MIKFLLIIGTISLLLCILSISPYAPDSLWDSETKIVPCYDKHNNIIQGATCETQTNDKQFFMLCIFAMFTISLMAIVIGIVEKYLE